MVSPHPNQLLFAMTLIESEYIRITQFERDRDMKRVMTLTAMLLLTFVVSCRRSGDTTSTTQPDRRTNRRTDRRTNRQFNRPPMLTASQIDECLNAELRRRRNPADARTALKKAYLELERTNKAEGLHKTVYWFKVARAHGHEFNTEEKKQFVDASVRLTKLVQKKYRDAYALERNHKYTDANTLFRELLYMLPVLGQGDDKSQLRQNVIAHAAYISRMTKTKKLDPGDL